MALDLSLSGLASGFDWKSFVDQMVDVERAPAQRLLRDQNLLNQKNSAYSNIKTQLAALQSRLATLKSGAVFEGRSAKTSDSSAASASVSSGGVQGVFQFNVSQLATSSRMVGASNAAAKLAPDGDISALKLSDAGFPTAVTAGIFTVNGKQVTISTSDTLQGVFDKISSATGATVTAAYDVSEDKIVLTGSTQIVLGSGTDTSNFLQAARLMNNDTNSVSSSLPLGSIRLGATLGAATFTTAVTTNGAEEGVFKINGEEISYDPDTDTVGTLLTRINNSSAGVTASYDSVNDRFTLVSKATGDIGIALEDVTGNFLAAAGLISGSATLQRGKDLLYTVNGGDEMRSRSNTITDESSGISGLSVTALKENTSFTVTTATDTTGIKAAITGFIEAYNKVQSLIDSQTASNTDAQGVVTAGILNGDRDMDEIATRLRSLVYSGESSESGSVKHLEDLGIVTNGNDNNLALADEDKLNSVLAASLENVKELFGSDGGIAAKLDEYLTRTVGENGSLVAHQNRVTQQVSDIDTQILEMERLVQANKERMTASFVAMETAQAKINQELQYLLKNFASAK